VARWISVAGHPFVVVIFLVGVVSVSRLGTSGALQPVALVTLAVLLPLGTFMYLRAKSGRWSTIDASRPAERPPLYLLALSLTAVLAAYFATSSTLGFLGRGGAAVCLLLVAAALLNRWIKTSLHVAFAAYAAAVLLLLNRPAGLAVLAFVPVLGWARLAMHRHSLLEVLAGALVGGLVGILAVAI
jgi:membrane-associated phospholipid phosphatase